MDNKISSEELLGIPIQPDNACPIIDNALKVIHPAFRKSYQQAIHSISHLENKSDLLIEVEKMGWALDVSIDALEDLRARCVELREWGQAWKDHAKSIEQK